MLTHRKGLLFAGAVFLVPIFLAFSCDRNLETTARIIVLDANQTPASNTHVHVFSPVGEVIDVEGTTNVRGEVFFNFSSYYRRGQAGLAVLDVVMTDENGSVLTDIIKIEPEYGNEKTYVYP